MGLLRELSVYLLCLGALATAIPVSLIEDMKDPHGPTHTNKVKRAQEVLMFGNQQNRAVNNYGSPRTEKRDIGDNSLAEAAVTLPEFLSQVEDDDYDTNHIGAPRRLHHSVPSQQQALGYGDLALYRMVDARRKRDAHRPPAQPAKNSFRAKRDYDLSPEELISLMRLLEKERRQNPRFHEQRAGWPLYGTDTDEVEFLGEGPDDNEIDTDADDYHRGAGGVWMDGPVQTPSQDDYWPKKYKRFMVSKRRSESEGFSSPYDFQQGVQPQRRFFL